MKNKSSKKTTLDYLRSWDAYGFPISFSFLGEDSCKTMFGSFLTIA